MLVLLVYTMLKTSMYLEKSSLWYKKVHLVRVRVSICCQSTDVCWVLEIVLIAGVIAVVLRLRMSAQK